MKDPMAPTAKEKKTGFYKLFGMSKRQWDQEIKWAQARKNKQRRKMKSFKEIMESYEGNLNKESYYAVVDKDGIIQFKGAKHIAKKKLKDYPGGFVGNTVSKKVGDKWGEIEEISTAQRAQRRRNRMQAHLKKTMAKYRAASKAGIHPSKVHQGRNKLTVKKS